MQVATDYQDACSKLSRHSYQKVVKAIRNLDLTGVLSEGETYFSYEQLVVYFYDLSHLGACRIHDVDDFFNRLFAMCHDDNTARKMLKIFISGHDPEQHPNHPLFAHSLETQLEERIFEHQCIIDQARAVWEMDMDLIMLAKQEAQEEASRQQAQQPSKKSQRRGFADSTLNYCRTNPRRSPRLNPTYHTRAQQKRIAIHA